MGILIRNGEEYTSKPKLDKTLSIEGQAADSKAVGDTKISHVDVVDNLESTATDLPLSANMGRELNDNMKWKHWKTVYGGDYINLPEDFNELHIRVVDTVNIIGYTFNLIKSDCEDTIYYRNGYYNNSNYYSIVSVKATSTTLAVVDFMVNASDAKNNMQITVSYR